MHFSVTNAVSPIHKDDTVTDINGKINSYSATTSDGKSLDPNDFGTKQARAIMDYSAISSDELSLNQHDICIIYRLVGLDPEYVMAEKNQKRGKVPLSYLEII